MPHLHVHEIYTACAHDRFLDTMPLETSSSPYIEHDAIFKFGWCPNCVNYLMSKNCRNGRPSIEVRNVDVLRSYWRYKAASKLATAVPSTDIPYAAYDPSNNARRLQYLDPFAGSALVWEERALLDTIAGLKPKQIHLGPLLFRLPAAEDALHGMLRGARQWTILWAKGDDMLYQDDPGLDLRKVWNPADDEGWGIGRSCHPPRPVPLPERGYVEECTED
ncbi:hypothetical protein PT974_09379 [Cladobotryum mycophilum]|uniref:Uncharacterized protein n=1 Tax=Cladobotryum mycophilum TaxID=491253 RepID=A0ABR0SHE1_9HYPO